MRSPHHKLFTIFLMILALNSSIVDALEFKKEIDKAKWIKEFFKDKEFEPGNFRNSTEEEIAFEKQFLKDFINQNGIENIEPIAVGKDINDPEIAKFNKACPEKKPINIHRWARPIGNGYISDYLSDEELEEENPSVDTMICTKNMKIYKGNLKNYPDGKDMYVLYCEDFHEKDARIPKKTCYSDPAVYMSFDPDKCIYSSRIEMVYPTCDNGVSGIFKYKNIYYFYEIETLRSTAIYIKSYKGMPYFKGYRYNTMEKKS